MTPQELARPVALAAAPVLLVVLIAYFLGGITAALIVGLLLLPVAWFALGFVGLGAAASVVMLSLAGLLLAQSVLESQGENVQQLSAADADVRQARRIAIMGAEARQQDLEETIRRQRGKLGDMSRRVERLERRTRALRSALRKARRRAR